MKITNTQAGPRGFYALNEARTGSNSIVLAPGETAEVEMSEGDLRASRATGWFQIEEPEEVEGEPEAEAEKPRRGRPRKPEAEGEAPVTLEG